MDVGSYFIVDDAQTESPEEGLQAHRKGSQERVQAGREGETSSRARVERSLPWQSWGSSIEVEVERLEIKAEGLRRAIR